MAHSNDSSPRKNTSPLRRHKRASQLWNCVFHTPPCLSDISLLFITAVEQTEGCGFKRRRVNAADLRRSLTGLRGLLRSCLLPASIGQTKMSRRRFILQRGRDCHVRVIDCSKDRGKSRNVIIVLLRLVPPPANQCEVKRDIDLRAAKTVV